jgi:hypothetical protein
MRVCLAYFVFVGACEKAAVDDDFTSLDGVDQKRSPIA